MQNNLNSQNTTTNLIHATSAALHPNAHTTFAFHVFTAYKFFQVPLRSFGDAVVMAVEAKGLRYSRRVHE